MPENQESTLTHATAAGLPQNFEERGVIGRGNNGVVIRAYDLILQREVAIKLLLADGARDAKSIQRFEREAKTLATLNHVNIVKLLSWGVSESGNPYHVLELLEGESLQQLLKKSGRLGQAKFKQIFTQLLRGLDSAHKAKVVHRDIKPSNIMVCKEADGTSVVKLIDFGIARLEENADDTGADTITNSNSVIGSPAYMSPEQCRGERVDYLSDIYSLGCVMYQCFTGNFPFEAESSMDLMYKHCHQDWVHLESILTQAEFASFARMIDSCLEKVPAKRPQSVAQIIHEFEDWAGPADSRKFFAIKGDTAPRSVRVPIISIFGLGFLFCMVLALTRFHNGNNVDVSAPAAKENSIMNSQADRTARTEKSYQKQLQELEAKYKHASTSEEKRSSAFDFIVIAKKLSCMQLDQDRLQDTEKTLQRIFPFAIDMDEPAIVTEQVMDDIAKVRLRSNNFDGAAAICTEGIENSNKISPEGNSNIMAALICRRAETYIRAHKIAAAIKDIQTLQTLWPAAIVKGCALNRFEEQHRKAGLERLWLLTVDQEYKSAVERLNNLMLLNLIGSSLMARGYDKVLAIDNDKTIKILEQIPKNTEGYNAVAQTVKHNSEYNRKLVKLQTELNAKNNPDRS